MLNNLKEQAEIEAAVTKLSLSDETSIALPGEADDVLDDIAQERHIEDCVDSTLNVDDMVHWQDGVIIGKRSQKEWWNPVVYRSCIVAVTE